CPSMDEPSEQEYEGDYTDEGYSDPDDGQYDMIEGYYTAVTDEDGRYSLEVVSGVYHVSIDSREHYGWRGEVIIDEGQDVTLNTYLEPKPEPDANISGLVLDEVSEEGIANAEVNLVMEYQDRCPSMDEPSEQEYEGDYTDEGYSDPDDGQYDMIEGYYTAVTDEDGRYSLEVVSGVYHVSIDSREHYGWRGEVVIGEGQDVTLNTYLKPLPPIDSVLTGTVRDMETGEPLEDASVYIWGTPGRSSFGPHEMPYDFTEERVKTGPDGTYSFNVRKGTYSVSLWLDGYYSYFTSVNIPRNTTSMLDMALEEIYVPPKDAMVMGKVIDENREAIEGALISLEMIGDWEMDHPMEPEMPPECGYEDEEIDAPDVIDYYYPYGHYENTSERDGSYSIECPQGVYVLSVWARGYMPKRMIVEPRSNIPLEVNLTLEDYPEPNSVITGVVKDRATGEPIPEAYVYVYADLDEPHHDLENPTESMEEFVYDRRQSDALVYDDDMGYKETTYYQDPWSGYVMFFCETMTDRNGEYTLDIPEGTFVLDIWAEGYTQSLTRFRIGENEKIRKEIHLQPGSREDEMEHDWLLPVGDAHVNDAPVSHMDGMRTSTMTISVERERWTIINLEDYFYDPNGESVSFSFSAPEDFQAYIDSENRLHVKAPRGYTGDENVVVYASDGQATMSSTMQMDVAGAGNMNYIVFGVSMIVALIVLGAFVATRKMGMSKKEHTDIEEPSEDKTN
ncbi:MAG: carboxypeptidase-like regulatory domain-containing protein, partial [Thermoplasmata archaeon]